jgi:hypothetical protein
VNVNERLATRTLERSITPHALVVMQPACDMYNRTEPE